MHTVADGDVSLNGILSAKIPLESSVFYQNFHEMELCFKKWKFLLHFSNVTQYLRLNRRTQLLFATGIESCIQIFLNCKLQNYLPMKKIVKKKNNSPGFEPNVLSFIFKLLSHLWFKIWILSKKWVHNFVYQIHLSLFL